MKKYILYWSAMLLSLVSLIGYLMVGNYLFRMSPTGETFDVYDGDLKLTPYIYVEPLPGILGVMIQSAGVFLYGVCFGILAKYCKLNLSLKTKYFSVVIFALCYVSACVSLFLNNFTILGLGGSYAVKAIWANAFNFLVCISASIFGFCAMYYFKNKDNHLIYGKP